MEEGRGIAPGGDVGYSLPSWGAANSELPFLVTHWLVNYRGRDGYASVRTDDAEEGTACAGESQHADERDEAVRRVRRAASELAEAFSALGAYGTAIQSPLGRRPARAIDSGVSAPSDNHVRNATYSDLSRLWSGSLPRTHLNSLIASGASGTAAASAAAFRSAIPRSYVDAAYDRSVSATEAGGSGGSRDGRRLGERAQEDDEDVAAAADDFSSVLRSQALIGPASRPSASICAPRMAAPSTRSSERQLTVSLQSDHTRLQTISSVASRKFLSLREKALEEEKAMRVVQRSLSIQNEKQVEVERQRMARVALHNTRAAAWKPPPSPKEPTAAPLSSPAGRVIAGSVEVVAAALPPVLANEGHLPAKVANGVSSPLGTAAPAVMPPPAALAEAAPHSIVADTGICSSPSATVAPPKQQLPTTGDPLVAAAVAQAASAPGAVGAGPAIPTRGAPKSSPGSAVLPPVELEEIRTKELEISRVTSQLNRKLAELLDTNAKTQSDLAAAKRELDNSYLKSRIVGNIYKDPFVVNLSSGLGNWNAMKSSILSTVLSRPSNPMLRPSQTRAILSQTHRSVLTTKLSHSVTINSHLFYPIYCLAFDKTGRYFITGADDHLVKLFHLGATVSYTSSTPRATRARCNYGGNGRGAVLVCTLRGHAGVITDIDVSADNSMLATGSEDGDCRVWGLRDGCPVAILRGHVGGVNMVSWSVLTPYRLVTTGQDGLARMWDIREAALKRYGSVVGDRDDFALPKLKRSDSSGEGDMDAEKANDGGEEESGSGSDSLEEAMLPPLPQRPSATSEVNAGDGGSATAESPAAQGSRGARVGTLNNTNNSGAIYVPPLPPGAEGGLGAVAVEAIPEAAAEGGGDGALAAAGNNGNNDNGLAPGAFVPNDSIDEGVHLLSKLQHGEPLPDVSQLGPTHSTRSSKKAVKVICLTRCPIGGHFATGSNDGIGRVWADEDDVRVEQLDSERRESNRDGDSESGMTNMEHLSTKKKERRREGTRKSGRFNAPQPVVASKSTLLATLAGHLNSITDIQYSSAGDRLLTASQKDGIVRIWAWGKEGHPTSGRHTHLASSLHSVQEVGHVTGGAKFTNLTQILIRLTPHQNSYGGTTGSSVSSRPGAAGAFSRRRSGGSSSSTSTPKDLGVLCDVAAWTCDDSKVVTSQSCLVKPTGTQIVPGSQLLYIWDSKSGQCLLGLSTGHLSSCPVLVPHPSDPAIVGTGGADGVLNVWNLDAGKCIFHHTNPVVYGPVDPPTDRGKNSGYLDGTFGPDGLNLVLTDDNGRITIVDCLSSADDVRRERESSPNGRSDVISLVSTSDEDAADRAAPMWMREQYFANDYYELFYDDNGYCIERGSEMPPHLSPRAARCTHTGTALSLEVNEAFHHMLGPIPLEERVCRRERDKIRRESVRVRREGGLLSRNVEGKRSVIVVQAGGDGFASSRMTFLDPMGVSSHREAGAAEDAGGTASARHSVGVGSGGEGSHGRIRTTSQSASSGRALSANYRWRDFDDVLQEEEFEEEDEDEDYEVTPRGHAVSANLSDDEATEMHDVSSEAESSVDEDAVERGSRQAASRSSRSATRASSSSGQMLGSRARGREGGRQRSSTAGRDARRRRHARRSATRDRAVAFEERTRSQASRVSGRQMTNRSRARSRPYVDPGSSDEEVVEVISTNNTPSGDHVDDYLVLGHYFKLPTGGLLERKWVTRTESKLGFKGQKMYCPQVGDSIIYIPKAHHDTIKMYPMGGNSSAPWKSWPNASPWPVVRCNVRDIRYRFPYESYYRNKDAKCLSVVAILSLDVTGIPEVNHHREFPWPKPEFICRRTRSTHVSFEVSVFVNGTIDFIMPEYLYVWRMKCLEDAILECDDLDPEGLKLVAFYPPEEEGELGYQQEDPKFIRWPCEVSTYTPEPHIPDDANEYHFQCSGMDAFEVNWETGDTNSMSPWELTVLDKENEVPSPPIMSPPVKAEIRKALNELKDRPDVKDWFYHPVNTRRYSDYLHRIEVPMSVSFILKRLDHNYYSNPSSVVFDVKVVRDNCIKYNDPHSEISELACDVYEWFKERIEEIDFEHIDDVSSSVNDRSQRHGGSAPESTAAVTRPSHRRSTSAGLSHSTSRTRGTVPSSESLERPTRASPRLSSSTPRNGMDGTTSEPPSSLEALPRPGICRRSTRSSSGVGREGTDGVYEDVGREASPSTTARPTRRSTRSAAVAATSTGRATRSSSVATMEETDQDKEDSSSSEEGESSEDESGSEDDSDDSCDESSNIEEEDDEASGSDDEHDSRGESPADEASYGSAEEEEKGNAPASRTRSSDSRRISIRTANARKKPTPQYAKKAADDSSDDSDGSDKLAGRQRNEQLSSTRQTRSSSRKTRAAARRDALSDYDDASTVEYVSEENEELGGAVSDSSDDFVPTRRSKKGGTMKRRKNAPANNQGDTKRPKVMKSVDKYLPDIMRWPASAVPAELLRKVGHAILDEMVKIDEDDVFATPVIEQAPDITDNYLHSIKEPMDFRTIREEKIQSYRVISDLQEDLILIFRNCCKYNGEDDSYWPYAVSCWNKINDIFKEVLIAEGLTVPRGW